MSIKIGTKRETLWTDVKEATEKNIKQHEEGLEIEREMLKLAETIIAEEEKK